MDVCNLNSLSRPMASARTVLMLMRCGASADCVDAMLDVRSSLPVLFVPVWSNARAHTTRARRRICCSIRRLRRANRVILPLFERCQCLVCEGVAWRTRRLPQLT